MLALVGLDIDLLPGNYVLGLEFEDGRQAGLSFRVSPRPSKATAVLPADLPPPVGLTPTEVLPEQWRRFHADSPPPPRDPPSAPTEARYVRNFADQHPFISYLTLPGSAVYTPLAGQVVALLPGQSGAALVMHHGQSLLSVIHPLQNIPVQTGEPINAGQRIGHVAPSPEAQLGWLDWAMLMNGASIDPDALRALLPIGAA